MNVRKIVKKTKTACMLALVMTMAVPVVSVVNPMTEVSAATVKISQKTLTLKVGKTKKLKVTGTSKKVTWSSNNKKVATVGKSTGKVTAIKEGKAEIKATVGSKTYTCKVTVVAETKKNDTEEAKLSSGTTFEVPKGFLVTDRTQAGVEAAMIKESSASGSMITFVAAPYDNNKTMTDKEFKNTYSKMITKEAYEKQLQTSTGIQDLTTDNYCVSEIKINGKVTYKISDQIKVQGYDIKQTIYLMNYNTKVVQVDVEDMGDSKADLAQIGETIAQTLKLAD